MNSEELYNFMQELVNGKFKYDKESAINYVIMVQSLVEYFGVDYKDVICDAVRNCKIVVAGTRENSVIRENVKDVLERENFHLSENPDKLKKLDRGFFAEPMIEFDNGSYKLVGVNRIIVLPAHFNSESSESLGILSRACIELVKSSINSYKIEGNVLTTKCGFMTRKENLEFVDGKVVRTETSCKGIGMYNGMNCYDQLCLIRLMYESSYDVHGEDYERILAGFVLESFGIKDEIRLCEIAHDDSQLKEIFKQNLEISFDEFLTMTDSIAHLEQNRKTSFMDDEELKLAIKKLDSNFGEIAVQMRRLGEVYETAMKTI